MNLLAVEGLSKSFGERVLFSDLNFGLAKGSKLALIGKNGEGKSTLLEVLMKRVLPDTGMVTWRNGINVGHLLQQDDIQKFKTIQDFFYAADNPFSNAIKAYKQAIINPEDIEGLDQASALMQQTGAWQYQQKIEELLSVFSLEFLEDTTQLAILSGGQLKRLSLIKLLLEDPDVFILDEPTNHLDVPMIEWLENYFSKENISLILVTHDRFFLNQVCNQILELDNGRGLKFNGNYEYYLEKKQEMEVQELAEISKAKNLYRKELDWVRRMPKARGTKSKARLDDFEDLSKKAKKRIKDAELQLDIKSERLGTKIVELHHVSKSFGDKKIIDDFSYVFKRGEKVGIAGRNGVGKTTFLNILLGITLPDTGKVVRGDTVQFAYYTQNGAKFDPEQRIIDAVKDIAEIIPLAKGRKITASQLLERFLFSPKKQYTPIGKLSGGEKKRLHLLQILMSNPNFLILDEPTNDLDIKTIGILEAFLEDFTGCLLIVSHDRVFMDNLTDHVFLFSGDGKIKDYNIPYSQILRISENDILPKNKKIEGKAKEESQKLSYEERKEYNKLEREIEKLEGKKNELLAAMLDSSDDANKLIDLGEKLNLIETEIEDKTDRWLLLAERA